MTATQVRLVKRARHAAAAPVRLPPQHTRQRHDTTTTRPTIRPIFHYKYVFGKHSSQIKRLLIYFIISRMYRTRPTC